MYSKVPEIDFGRFVGGSAKDRSEVAAQFDEALKTVGFIHLRNHGIELSKIDQCFEWSSQLFQLPNQEKEKLSPLARSFQQGYFGLEKEKIRGQTCMKENFDFGNPKDDSRGLWPSTAQLPGFREFAADFHNDCSRLIDQLLECASLALNLSPTESLGQHHSGSMFVSSLLHYPVVPVEQIRSGAVVRNPAHSDFGSLTLLFQRDVGGLQVADMSSTDKVSSVAVNKQAQFLDVEPRRDTILVNVGYLLMRWTNGRWKNTVHRVSEPPASFRSQDSVPERYSIAFFSFPDPETEVEPLNSCCSIESPKNWKSINAGNYLLEKRAVLYS